MRLTPAVKRLFDTFITDSLNKIEPMNLNECRNVIAMLQSLPYRPHHLGTQAQYSPVHDDLALHILNLAIGLSNPQYLSQQIKGLSENDWYILGQIGHSGRAGHDNYLEFKALFQDKIQAKIDHLEKIEAPRLLAAENLANAKAAHVSIRKQERASRHLKIHQPGFFSKPRPVDFSSGSESEHRVEAPDTPRLR